MPVFSGCVCAPPKPVRFKLDSYRVYVAGKTRTIVLKFDSATGEVRKILSDVTERKEERAHPDLRSQEDTAILLPRGEIPGYSTYHSTEADAQRQRAVLRTLKRITIPEIDFRQADIRDVVTFLQAGAAKNVNIMLNLGRPTASPQTRPALGDEPDLFAPAVSAHVEGSQTNEPPLITFAAKQIPLLDALESIAFIANLKYRIEEDVVMLVPANAPDGPLMARVYPVGELTAEDENHLRDFLRTTVQWPEHSRMEWMPSQNLYFIVNTVPNHRELYGHLTNPIASGEDTGRYRLFNAERNAAVVPRYVDEATQEGGPELFLLDTKTGFTWVYRCVFTARNGILEAIEWFQRVHEIY